MAVGQVREHPGPRVRGRARHDVVGERSERAGRARPDDGAAEVATALVDEGGRSVAGDRRREGGRNALLRAAHRRRVGGIRAPARAVPEGPVGQVGEGHLGEVDVAAEDEGPVHPAGAVHVELPAVARDGRAELRAGLGAAARRGGVAADQARVATADVELEDPGAPALERRAVPADEPGEDEEAGRVGDAVGRPVPAVGAGIGQDRVPGHRAEATAVGDHHAVVDHRRARPEVLEGVAEQPDEPPVGEAHAGGVVGGPPAALDARECRRPTPGAGRCRPVAAIEDRRARCDRLDRGTRRVRCGARVGRRKVGDGERGREQERGGRGDAGRDTSQDPHARPIGGTSGDLTPRWGVVL